MINTAVLEDSNLGDEDDKLEDNENTICPIFKTEITLIVNASDEESSQNENSVVLRNKKPYVSQRETVTSRNHLRATNLDRSEFKYKTQITDNNKQSDARHTFSFGERPPTLQESKNNRIFTKKINNSNNIPSSYDRNLDVNSNELMTKISDDEVDFVPCVIRKSESVDTIDKIEKELSYFVMDNKKKEKKRTSSFRKLFSVFGKDKKKKEKGSDIVHQPSSDNTDNYQNETNSNSFIRNTPRRHTVGCDHSNSKKNNTGTTSNGYHNVPEEPSPEIIEHFANHHINKFRKIRQSFEYPDDELSNIRNENNIHNHPRNIAPHITKYIDTSSSTSTLESEKPNAQQQLILKYTETQQPKQHEGVIFISDDKLKLARHESLRRETPPRAQDTYQLVNIVKPKARLPISSGRPLPNPYQHEEAYREKDSEKRKPVSNYSFQENRTSPCPELNEIYGTVFDAIPCGKYRDASDVKKVDCKILPLVPKSPKSPSLEVSKLKLPPNREILPSQPRMQSPLPISKVSSEKIIATELLKNMKTSDEKGSRSNLSQVTDQHNLSNGYVEELNIVPQAESTPDSKTSVSEAINALRSELELNDHNLKQELDHIKSTLQNLTHSESTNIYAVNNTMNNGGESQKNSPRGTLITSPRSSTTISPLPQAISGEAVRSSPNTQIYSPSSTNEEVVELRQKNILSSKYGTHSSRSPTSPNKEEIRRSVEAYYWKEIKRIKEQEDYQIYLSHLHFSHGGYAEDPIFSRRTRDIDDSRARRSSSVPRSVRQHLNFEGTSHSNRPVAIPEGSSVLLQPRRSDIYGHIPPKNYLLQAASRNTIQPSISKSSKDGEYATYKPIFRRGSLSGNTYQPVQMNQYKKVSFSNSQQVENLASWPTKNGFTKSPPQRRLEKLGSRTLEDDVFLPTSIQNHQNVQYQSASDEYNRLRMRHNYNSETESNYSSQNMNIYGYNKFQFPNPRSTNYSSDSEAVHSMQRRYKTISHQELENLRNSQLKATNPTAKKQYVPRLTRHESIQFPEPTYGYAVQYGADGRGSYKPNSLRRDIPGTHNVVSLSPQRRDILITDNIYGQHIGYCNDTVGSLYGYSTHNNFNTEPLYVPKSVTVRNKVCDIYGRIHDTDSSHDQIQATGVLMGQLQSSPNSPNFKRGTRLTASNNDMLLRRRQPNFQQTQITRNNQSNRNLQSNVANAAPVRPLPPLPPTGRKIQNESSKNTASKKNTNSSKKKRK